MAPDRSSTEALPTSTRLSSVVDLWLDAERRHRAAWLSLCFLFASAGALGLLLALVGPATGADLTGLLVLTGVALLFGLAGPRLEIEGPRVVELLLWVGAGMVAVAVLLTGEASAPMSLFFVWVGVEGALLLDFRAALRLLALGIAALTALSLALPDGDVAFYGMAVGSMLVLAALAWMLRLRVERLAARLHQMARVDALTSLPNRRGYQEIVNAEIAASRRSGNPLSVVVGDLDSFAAFNEQHGHARGDQALLIAAQAFAAIRRGGDLVARTGGKQFALVLPNTVPEAARELAERVRRTIAMRLAEAGTPATASFGIAAYPAHGRSAETVLDAADQARAVAKDQGRDRSVVYSIAAVEQLRVRRAQPRALAEQIDAVLLLAETLDLRDPRTAKHSQTVGAYAEQTAARLRLPKEHVQRIRLAGLLHDIGKLGVPDVILHKPGPLTPDEFAEIKRHPEIGSRILVSAGLAEIGTWVLAHHERPDGAGYPRGLTLAEIPLEARILAVADSYEAMTAERVYSTAMPEREAAAELRRCAGTQFDEQVVDAFLASLTWTGDLRVA